jgi:catechol 2,3-dioxygenase-like lactoylglutathione lyase family enzyme
MGKDNVKGYDVGGVRLPRPFKIRRLGHGGFDVSSLDKMVEFYTQILGFRLSDTLDLRYIPDLPPQFQNLEDPRGAFMNVGSDHHTLILLHKSVNQAQGTSRPGLTLNQLSWQVNSLSEVVEGGKYLAEHGLNLQRVGRDSPGSNWHVYFDAPDGHINELFYGIEQIGWSRKSKPREMPVLQWGEIALPQRSESAEVADAEARGIDINAGHRIPAPKAATYPVGGVLLERPFKIVRLGTVRLFVENLDETAAFYRDTLGLIQTEEVEFEGMRCLFFRSGTEHHSLALYPLALRERLGLSSHSRCMSLGLQVGNYAQLRDAKRFLEEQGCKVIDMPVELHPGIDYTVSLLDPEGHCLQLYYYMEQIGWDGEPRPANQRRAPKSSWPDSVEPQSDTFTDSPFQGPLD